MMERFGLVHRMAINNLREGIRERLFSTVALFAVFMVAGSLGLKEFDFGRSSVYFITDFGFGVLSTGGALLAIFLTAQLFFRDLENRTAVLVLARPVRRSDFVLGKAMGAAYMLAVFVAFVGLVLWGLVLLSDDGSAAARPHVWLTVLFFQWMRLCLLSGVTLLVSTYAHSQLFAVVTGFMLMVVCEMQGFARSFWQMIDEPVLSGALAVVGVIFPDFGLFRFGPDELLIGMDASGVALAGLLGYSLAYLVMIHILGSLSFARRQV